MNSTPIPARGRREEGEGWKQADAERNSAPRSQLCLSFCFLSFCFGGSPPCGIPLPGLAWQQTSATHSETHSERDVYPRDTLDPRANGPSRAIRNFSEIRNLKSEIQTPKPAWNFPQVATRGPNEFPLMGLMAPLGLGLGRTGPNPPENSTTCVVRSWAAQIASPRRQGPGTVTADRVPAGSGSAAAASERRVVAAGP